MSIEPNELPVPSDVTSIGGSNYSNSNDAVGPGYPQPHDVLAVEAEAEVTMTNDVPDTETVAVASLTLNADYVAPLMGQFVGVGGPGVDYVLAENEVPLGNLPQTGFVGINIIGLIGMALAGLGCTYDKKKKDVPKH
jgi:hypothetical protein